MNTKHPRRMSRRHGKRKIQKSRVSKANGCLAQTTGYKAAISCRAPSSIFLDLESCISLQVSMIRDGRSQFLDRISEIRNPHLSHSQELCNQFVLSQPNTSFGHGKRFGVGRDVEVKLTIGVSHTSLFRERMLSWAGVHAGNFGASYSDMSYTNPVTEVCSRSRKCCYECRALCICRQPVRWQSHCR
jgi:hypothetical protein